VVVWEPPARFEYQIIKGLPVKHNGSVKLRAHNGGTEIRWRVEMRSRVPLVAEVAGTALRLALARALRHFAASFAN
jgi:carbon monoxide dehydrogenase subunit G